VAEMAGN